MAVTRLKSGQQKLSRKLFKAVKKLYLPQRVASVLYKKFRISLILLSD